MTIQQDGRNGSTRAQSEPDPPADLSTHPANPSSAERAMAANAASRSRQAKQARTGDHDAVTPQIKAAKQRSAELLRDAVDLVTLRTHDS